MNFPENIDLVAALGAERAQEIVQILALIKAEGGKARLVGGIVRDLVSRDLADPQNSRVLVGNLDIDIASTLSPERMLALFRAAPESSEWKVLPHDLEHGTIKLVTQYAVYDLTVLRQDVETYGRRARVSFLDSTESKGDESDPWRVDAARRDFTINAIYLDADGVIYDPFDGRKDLGTRRVRFIGEEKQRIKEDYLRIYRFYRFSARYGGARPDAAGDQACQALKAGIAGLSAERVGEELSRILSGPRPDQAFFWLESAGLLEGFPPLNLSALAHMVEKEDISPVALRLAVLLAESPQLWGTIATRLFLSRKDKRFLSDLRKCMDQLPPGDFKATDGIKWPDLALKRAIYFQGKELVRAYFFWLEACFPSIKPALSPYDAILDSWTCRPLKIETEDFDRLGIPSDSSRQRLLSGLIDWWLSGDCQADQAACRQKLAELAKQTGEMYRLNGERNEK